MKTLEIIHLRLAGDSPQRLADIFRKAIGTNLGVNSRLTWVVSSR